MRTRDRERGAVLVETVLSLPVFFLLIFAIIEFGFVFRDHTTINASTTAGARTLAISGDDLDADYRTLQEVLLTSAPLPAGAIDQIIIYAASGPSDPVPSACLTGSVASLCNVYTEADLARPASDFGCADAAAPDWEFCPTSRDTTQATASFVGLHIRGERELITGFFGDSRTLRSTDVLRVEPRDR